ncbi:hypothetical protein DFJ73DRAFT_825480 [Zopfochytrium polystomum]|nr:hypothetical protein DFJ73DRAFT_825480 [Zopfochytrium polystomum]
MVASSPQQHHQHQQQQHHQLQKPTTQSRPSPPHCQQLQQQEPDVLLCDLSTGTTTTTAAAGAAVNPLSVRSHSSTTSTCSSSSSGRFRTVVKMVELVREDFVPDSSESDGAAVVPRSDDDEDDDDDDDDEDKDGDSINNKTFRNSSHKKISNTTLGRSNTAQDPLSTSPFFGLTATRQRLPFKSSWTIGDFKMSIKQLTGLSVHEQVLIFQDHQLTDNIRPSAEDLNLLAANGGFVLRRRGQKCGNKRLFSKGIRGLATFLARNYGICCIPPPPPPPPPVQDSDSTYHESTSAADSSHESSHESMDMADSCCHPSPGSHSPIFTPVSPPPSLDHSRGEDEDLDSWAVTPVSGYPEEGESVCGSTFECERSPPARERLRSWSYRSSTPSPQCEEDAPRKRNACEMESDGDGRQSTYETADPCVESGKGGVDDLMAVPPSRKRPRSCSPRFDASAECTVGGLVQADFGGPCDAFVAN